MHTQASNFVVPTIHGAHIVQTLVDIVTKCKLLQGTQHVHVVQL